MSLESRAASARQSLQASVAGVVPIGMPVVVRRQRMSLLTSFVAAAAMVLAFVGVASAMPSFFDPDQVAGSENATPDPDGAPIIVDPDDKEKDGELVELDPKPSTVAVRQTNSEADSPAPWTKFYGEADPGTRVSALSDWGNADQRWQIRHFFQQIGLAHHIGEPPDISQADRDADHRRQHAEA